MEFRCGFGCRRAEGPRPARGGGLHPVDGFFQIKPSTPCGSPTDCRGGFSPSTPISALRPFGPYWPPYDPPCRPPPRPFLAASSRWMRCLSQPIKGSHLRRQDSQSCYTSPCRWQHHCQSVIMTPHVLPCCPWAPLAVVLCPFAAAPGPLWLLCCAPSALGGPLAPLPRWLLIHLQALLCRRMSYP